VDEEFVYVTWAKHLVLKPKLVHSSSSLVCN